MLLRSESKMIIKPTNNHKSIIIDQVLLDINYIIVYINRYFVNIIKWFSYTKKSLTLKF